MQNIVNASFQHLTSLEVLHAKASEKHFWLLLILTLQTVPTIWASIIHIQIHHSLFQFWLYCSKQNSCILIDRDEDTIWSMLNVSSQYANWTLVTYVLNIYNFSGSFVSKLGVGMNSSEYFCCPYSTILHHVEIQKF